MFKHILNLLITFTLLTLNCQANVRVNTKNQDYSGITERVLKDVSEVLNLPEVNVDIYYTNNMPENFLGTYANNNIMIKEPYVNSDAVVLHEFGHLIDNTIIASHFNYKGYDDFASNKNKSFKPWLKAIKKCPEYQLFKEYDNKCKTKYWTDPTEMWARSFCQYIVTKATDKVLKDHFTNMQQNGNEGLWSNEHFTPILNEMDNIFSNLKWSKKVSEGSTLSLFVKNSGYPQPKVSLVFDCLF